MKPKLDQLIDNAIDVLQSALEPYNTQVDWNKVDAAIKILSYYISIVKAGISAKAQAAQQSPEQLEKQKEQLAKIERLLGKVSQ